MLFARRQRLNQIEEAEASGQSFWSARFDSRARVKLLYAFRDAIGHDYIHGELAEMARELILRDEGLPYLNLPMSGAVPDFLTYVEKCDDELVPTVIEAMVIALLDGHNRYGDSIRVRDFVSTVNTMLQEHRISFELVGPRMIPFTSKELHVEVIEPTLRLLSGRSGWEEVERPYQDALEELANGKAGDAITDVGTALQQALVVLGCRGNSLGPLIRDARSRGLLGSHDSVMTDAIERLLHWVSADRSEVGDAHGATSASRDDAWLTVHVVGALILRLAGEQPRRSP